MGVRYPSVFSTTLANPLPANANETVILTTPPLTLPIDFAQVIIQWAFTILYGGAVSSVVMRLRRGTLVTGALVFAGVWTQVSTAATNAVIAGVYVDTPGAVGGQQYSLTIVQTAAAGASTITDLCMTAFAL